MLVTKYYNTQNFIYFIEAVIIKVLLPSHFVLMVFNIKLSYWLILLLSV